jgi:magnesium transporter
MKIRLVKNGVFELVENVVEATRPPESGFYWIDADTEDLLLLQKLFHIDDLVVEDIMQEEEQRPKIEVHEKLYYIVVNSIRYDDEEIFIRELNLFLGEHYIITVTKQRLNDLRAVKPILLQEEVNKPDYFLYHLMDLVVDNYFTVIDKIEVKIEKLDEDILIHMKKEHLNEIVGLRSEILWLKKVLGPQRDLIAALKNRNLRLIDEKLQKYFSDIHENMVKITESFDTFRELVGNLREAYQLSLANRANDLMRVFTALTTIFMPMTVITGLYGMNFSHMPELDWKYGYFMVLGVIFTMAGTMIYIFRKKEWL